MARKELVFMFTMLKTQQNVNLCLVNFSMIF